MPTYFPDLPPLPRLPNPAAPFKRFAEAASEGANHAAETNQALHQLNEAAMSIRSTLRELFRRRLP